MPIIRKLIIVGNSQAVTIPNTWLNYAEQQKNRKIIAIAMEVDGAITMNPIFSTGRTAEKKNPRDSPKGLPLGNKMDSRKENIKEACPR